MLTTTALTAYKTAMQQAQILMQNNLDLVAQLEEKLADGTLTEEHNDETFVLQANCIATVAQFVNVFDDAVIDEQLVLEAVDEIEQTA